MADDPGKEEENTATDAEGAEEAVQAEEGSEDLGEQDESKSLDMILDIPLTVTVEWDAVKC